jgi:hypothetical protein
MTTLTFNFVVDSEIDEAFNFTYLNPSTGLPVDLTGYDAEMQVRCRYGGYSTPDVAFYFNTNTTPTPGGITLGGTQGTISVSFSQTSLMVYGATEYTYDLILRDPNGLRTKILKGFFTIQQTSTRIEQTSLPPIS